MTDLVVIRDDGDRPGPAIVEPLLATEAVALVRGRVELDENERGDEVRLTLGVTDVRLGQTIAVNDPNLGRLAGKVIMVSHNLAIDDEGNVTGETAVSLRRL